MAGSQDPNDNPVAINVVPMVDVIFCLCVFFMCSMKFKEMEGKFDSWLPKDKGQATPMSEVMAEMSRKSFGMTCVVDSGERLVGIITDGDLRRHMLAAQQGTARSILERRAGEVMTSNPVTVTRGMLAVEALRLMEERKITSIVVVDAGRKVEGIVHLHDLWRTQLF